MSTDIQGQHHQETPVKKIRRSAAQWQRIMKKYEASGSNQQTFCAQQGLAMSSFYTWRKKLKTHGEPPLADDPGKIFVEVVTTDHETQSALRWDVELALNNGMVLRLRQS